MTTGELRSLIEEGVERGVQKEVRPWKDRNHHVWANIVQSITREVTRILEPKVVRQTDREHATVEDSEAPNGWTHEAPPAQRGSCGDT